MRITQAQVDSTLDVTALRGERPLSNASCARPLSVRQRDDLVMTSFAPTLTTRSVSVPAEFFGALRESAARHDETVIALRDAGYAAGVALYDSFGQWLDERGEASAEDLMEDRFGEVMAEFLTITGWGALQVVTLSDAVVALDAYDWAEVTARNGASPMCHAGTGLLAGFFGCVAEAPLAVLEVECQSMGHERCRFLIGSVDVLQYVYEAMERGVPYDRAANSAATG